jgi:hypothetical protein
MRHRALAVGVVDGDAVVPAEVPAVGAEGAVGDVSQEYVAPALLRLDGCPEDCAHCRVVVDALDDELLAVAERCRLVRGCEVAAVGGAVKEDEGDVVADDSVHPPRRVQRRAHRAQGDAPPVLVGVEVPAAHAALQADEGTVREELHRGPALVGLRSGQERRKRSGAEQVFVATVSLGRRDRGGQFQGEKILGAGRLLRMPPVNRLVGPSWGPRLTLPDGPSRINLEFKRVLGGQSDIPRSSTGGDVVMCRA